MANSWLYRYAKDLIQTGATEQVRGKAAELREGFRWQYVTSINPLTEFTGTVNGGVVVADEVIPTINSLDFRRNIDEKLVLRGDPGTQRSSADRVRTTAHYFTSTVTIGDTTPYRHLGRYAPAVNADGKRTKPGDNDNADIDFVVRAYDQFGTRASPGRQRLNPFAFTLSVTGREPNTEGSASGTVQSFDFSKAFGPPPFGITRFFNVSSTRTFYENDANHNTEMVPTAAKPDDPYYYILTNNTNLNLATANQPPLGNGITLPGSSPPSWSSRAEKGHGLYWVNVAPNNAAAAYPDGLYTVVVYARDLPGAQASRGEKVLLTNWQRTVEIDPNKKIYRNTEVIPITGGVQYLAQQNVNLYAIVQGGAVPQDNTPLPAAALKKTATTDASGKLRPVDLPALPSGKYYIVADYNGDGIYTAALDAFTLVETQGPPQGQAPPPVTVTLTSSLNPAHYTEPITLRANAAYPGGGAPPTPGWFHFFDGPTYLGTVAMNSPGFAVLQGVNLTPGPHPIAVHFTSWDPGDRSATLTQTILPNTTSVTLTADRTTTDHFETVQFTASVTAPWRPAPPAGGVSTGPTGVVKFFADGEEFASGKLDANGQVTVGFNELLRGSPVVTAKYLGDYVFEGSTSNSRTQTVRNILPALGADAITTTVGSGVRVVVWRNDYDYDGDVLTITTVTTPAHGTATLAADGSIVYTPSPGYIGNDTFTYTVSDGNGGTATTTVSVRVLPQWAGSRVFTDANANGVQDAGDVGIPFVLVRVLNSVGVEVAAVLTDDNGYYTLPVNLPAGNYRLQFVMPGPLPVVPFSGKDLGGDDARDSDVDATGTTGLIAFAPATGWPDIDAGIVIDPNSVDVAHLFG